MKHKAGILLEREKSLLPDTQTVIERDKIRWEVRVLASRRRMLFRRINEQQAKIPWHKSRGRYRYIEVIEGKVANLYFEIGQIDVQIDLKQRIVGSVSNVKGKKVVRPCPADNCKGFLKEDWICGICEVNVCSKCQEVIKDKHKCDPNTVKSVKLKEHESTQCPSCNAPIYKIDGCNQIWCTNCNTAFDYRTGEIEHGSVHNPHYFEWVRRNGGDDRARQIGVCGLIPLYTLETILRIRNVSDLRNYHRNVTHVHQVLLPFYPNNYDVNTHENLRKKYLLGKITEEKWKNALRTAEKKRLRNGEVRQILDTYVMISVQIFLYLNRPVNQISRRMCVKVLHNLRYLEGYVDEKLNSIWKRYKMITHFFIRGQCYCSSEKNLLKKSLPKFIYTMDELIEKMDMS